MRSCSPLAMLRPRALWWLLGCLCALLAPVSAGPHGQPCGLNEERACLPCNEASCSVPYYLDTICIYTALCRLGCGCRYGFLRHDDTLACVPVHSCDVYMRFQNSKAVEELANQHEILAAKSETSKSLQSS